MQYQKGEFILVPNKHAIQGMKGATQSVYLWICAHMNEDNICFPSKATIAKEAGISQRAVFDCIEELVQKGIIKKTQRRSNDGSKRQQSNLYKVLILRRKTSVQPVHGEGAIDARGVMQAVHGEDAPAAEELKPKNINSFEQKNTISKNTGTSSEPPPSMVEKEQTPGEISEKSASEIDAVIDKFKLVNEAYADLFKRPHERKAAKSLLTRHSMEEVASMVEYIRDHVGEEYAYVVTRPAQLVEKWSQIEAKRKRRSGKEMTFLRTQEEVKNPKSGTVYKV